LFNEEVPMTLNKWSKSEKEIARRVFDTAYARECTAIADEVRKRATDFHGPNGLWSIQSYLAKKRRSINWKYEYAYPLLVDLFARLLREGWITIQDLSGLSEEKIDAIKDPASPG
jgi:hypothetical protein